MAKMGFQTGELPLIGTAAFLVFSRVFGLSLVLPNFRTHYDDLSFDPLWIGVAFGAYGLTMALMQFPNGVLSDRFGRRPLLWTATAFFVGGSVVASQATSEWTLIGARLVQGMGAVASVAVAAVGETVPAQRRTVAMALVGIPAGTGFILGMGAGPAMYPHMGMEGLFLVTAAFGLLAAAPLLVVRMPRPAHPPTPAPTRTAPVLALALAGFASNYIMTTALFFLPDGTPDALPILMLGGLASMLTLSRVIDKRGWSWQPLAMAAAGLGLSAAVWVGLPGAWFWVGGFLFFIFHSILSTVLPSQVSRIAGARGGRGHGIQNVISYSGTFAGGSIAGALAAQSNGALALAVAVGLVSAGLILRHLRPPQPSNGPTPGPNPEP